MPRQAWRVNRACAGLAIGVVHRALHRVDAFSERRGRLVSEAVVVLDDVDTRPGERACDRGEVGRRQSLRLQRRAGQRTTARAGKLTNAGDAEAGAAKMRDERSGKLGIDERDVVVQRCVAEQHVEKLTRFEAGRFHREAQAHVEDVGGDRRDFGDLRHDFAQHARVPHRRQRRFDALLERDRLRTGVDRIGRRAHAIGGGDPAVGGGRRGHHSAILVERRVLSLKSGPCRRRR